MVTNTSGEPAILIRIYSTGGAWLEDQGDAEDLNRRADEENELAEKYDLPWRLRMVKRTTKGEC